MPSRDIMTCEPSYIMMGMSAETSGALREMWNSRPLTRMIGPPWG
jgi:hypothetical protein